MGDRINNQLTNLVSSQLSSSSHLLLVTFVMSMWLLWKIVVYGNTGFMGIKKHQEVVRVTFEDLPNFWNLRDCIFWKLSNIATPKDPLAYNVSVDFSGYPQIY